MAALMVPRLSTLPVSAPKVDSAIPPPMAAAPPSDFAFCISTRKTKTTETMTKITEKMEMSTLIKGQKQGRQTPFVNQSSGWVVGQLVPSQSLWERVDLAMI